MKPSWNETPTKVTSKTVHSKTPSPIKAPVQAFLSTAECNATKERDLKISKQKGRPKKSKLLSRSLMDDELASASFLW